MTPAELEEKLDEIAEKLGLCVRDIAREVESQLESIRDDIWELSRIEIELETNEDEG